MSQTPEKRAGQIMDRYQSHALWVPADARRVEQQIARAIRSAENAQRKRILASIDLATEAGRTTGNWRGCVEDIRAVVFNLYRAPTRRKASRA